MVSFADNTDAVIDAGTDKVIFIHHAAGKDTVFDLFAFSIVDFKNYSWMFVLIAHRKALLIVDKGNGDWDGRNKALLIVGVAAD